MIEDENLDCRSGEREHKVVYWLIRHREREAAAVRRRRKGTEPCKGYRSQQQGCEESRRRNQGQPRSACKRCVEIQKRLDEDQTANAAFRRKENS